MLMLSSSQIICHPQACSIVLARADIGDAVSEGMIGVVASKGESHIAVTFENGEQIEFDTRKTCVHFDFFITVTDRYVPMPQKKDGIVNLSSLFESGAIDAALYQTHNSEQAIRNQPLSRH